MRHDCSMAHPAFLRHKATQLRRKGYSLKEISKRLKVTKSTAAVWVSDVELTPEGERRLLTRIKLCQFISAKKKRARTVALERRYLEEAKEELILQPNADKIMCAMLYWCEGGKNPFGGVAFTNSDPKLVRTFLGLLRKSFILDESKFRPCIHIHFYHLAEKQLDFWSKVTDIDKRQFIKPYQKPNTGKRIRINYEGCIGIRYHSNDLARRLLAIAMAYLQQMGA
jgi:hypothetical protein